MTQASSSRPTITGVHCPLECAKPAVSTATPEGRSAPQLSRGTQGVARHGCRLHWISRFAQLGVHPNCSRVVFFHRPCSVASRQSPMENMTPINAIRPCVGPPVLWRFTDARIRGLSIFRMNTPQASQDNDRPSVSFPSGQRIRAQVIGASRAMQTGDVD